MLCHMLCYILGHLWSRPLWPGHLCPGHLKLGHLKPGHLKPGHLWPEHLGKQCRISQPNEMHSYLFSCVCRLDTPGCCHLTGDGQLRPGLYSCGHFRWHTSNTPRRCAPCQLCSGGTIPNTPSRQDRWPLGAGLTNRHKVREEEVAPKGRNATIQFPSLVHCKHGCLIYCHTDAFSMWIRLHASNPQQRTDTSSGRRRSDTSSLRCAIDFNRIGM